MGLGEMVRRDAHARAAIPEPCAVASCGKDLVWVDTGDQARWRRTERHREGRLGVVDLELVEDNRLRARDQAGAHTVRDQGAKGKRGFVAGVSLVTLRSPIASADPSSDVKRRCWTASRARIGVSQVCGCVRVCMHVYWGRELTD